MRALTALLLAAACCWAAGARAIDLLDPASVVEAASTQSQGLERWKRPGFCGEMDCPPFKCKQSTDNYDLRRYEAGKWVVANVTGTKFELAYTQGVAKVLKYFKGGNDQGETIHVTTPTLAEVKLDKEGQSASKDFSFSLWLPEKYHRDTPQPSDADVKVVDFDEITVYVRVFGGFATEGTILDEARSLRDILEDDERDYSDDVVWAAVYDPPQKLLKRHNEIHVPKLKQLSSPTE